LGITGAGVGDLRGEEDPPNPAKREEKNPLAWGETTFRVSVLDFSDPTVYTHRATSASMWRADKVKIWKSPLGYSIAVWLTDSLDWPNGHHTIRAYVLESL
jgi:hypothetical protein